MCFSATASFAAGFVLTGIGAACLARAPDRRSLPFAAIPLLFGLQQAVEGGLWLALYDREAATAACFATGFSAFSQVLWPLYVPLAVWLIEPDARRRRLIALCGAAGAIVGLGLLYGLIRLPVTGELVDGHIFYRSDHFDALYNAGLFAPASLLYVAATCVSLMLASDRLVNAIGAAMALGFTLTLAFYETWLISVWCFFAAMLSTLIWVWVQRRAGTPLIPSAQTA